MILNFFSLGAMAQALRANIDWKSPFLKVVGHFGPKFQVEGDVPHQLFVNGYRPVNALHYTTLPLKVFTQGNFVANILREKPIFIRKAKKSLLRPLWGLETT